MTTQFGRIASLFATNALLAIDLSQLHFSFQTSAQDNETPNLARIRVYNMAPSTQERVRSEFTSVILQAGYRQGAVGTIFKGSIIQARRGHESPADQYTDIIAADGDIPYQYAKVKAVLDGQITNLKQAQTLQDALHAAGAEANASIPEAEFATGGILPRGKVLYGLVRTHLRNLAQSTSTSWSIQNGRLQMTSIFGVLPNQAVVLNAKTGLIGFPEQTENGVMVKCLINPLILPGCLIQLDNGAINEAETGTTYSTVNLFASIPADGFYKVLVVECEGDSRGNSWYQNLTCIAVDQSATSGIKVTPYL